MKRVLVCLPEGVWEVIEKEFKGKLGGKSSEILRNIIMAYLSEKGILEKVREVKA